MQAAEDETKLTTLDNKAELVYGGPVACHQVHSREVRPSGCHPLNPAETI